MIAATEGASLPTRLKAGHRSEEREEEAMESRVPRESKDAIESDDAFECE